MKELMKIIRCGLRDTEQVRGSTIVLLIAAFIVALLLSGCNEPATYKPQPSSISDPQRDVTLHPILIGKMQFSAAEGDVYVIPITIEGVRYYITQVWVGDNLHGVSLCPVGAPQPLVPSIPVIVAPQTPGAH